MTLNKTNREIFINILTSILGMLITTLVLLYVYRLANSKLGIEQIGLWSIVTTLTSFGNIGTFGIAGSLVKFSAELRSKGERDTIIGLLNSCILIMSGLIVLFLLLLFLFAWFFLDKIVDVKYLSSAFRLLPYSFGIFFLTTIGYLILSVVEGLNKGWQRNTIVIISNLVFLICIHFWVEQFGIYGIFYSQLVQALVMLILSFVLIRVNFSNYNMYTLSRDKALLTRVTKYGLKFQSVSVFQMLGEPVTKFFLSRYGGLGLVGIFEMASRMVVQVRTILTTITANLLPKLVDIYINQPGDKVRQVFSQIFRVNFHLFAVSLGALIIFASFIVQLWLGEINEKLVILVRLLSIAWFVNSIAVAPYIFNLGSGQLSGNVISHAIMGMINIVFGVVIILFNLKADFFIYGWMLALIIGSLYIIIEFNLRNKLSIKGLATRENGGLLLIILGHYLFVEYILSATFNYYILVFCVLILMYIGFVVIYLLRSDSAKIIKQYIYSFIRPT